MNLRRILGYELPLTPALRRNYIHLYFDIGWWGIYMGTTMAFLAIFAARSGATREQLGLLSAIPALISLLFSLPSGNLTRRLGAHKATILGAALARIPLLAYVVLPLVLLPQHWVTGLLVTAAVLAVPQTLVGVSFNQFLMESVPTRHRGEVVALRMAIMAVITFLVTMGSGQLLTRLAFPTGYQVVFFFGALGAGLTTYHIWRTKPIPDPDQRVLSTQIVSPPRRFFPHLDAQGLSYLRILGLLFAFNFVNSMFVPVVPDLLVNRLQLSDATISLGTALTYMLVFGVSLVIARLIRRLGNQRTTAVGALILVLHALTLAFARDETLYFASILIGGLGSGMLSTAQYNYNLDHVPFAERSNWMGINLFTGNASALLGALAGPLVANLTGLGGAFLVFAGLRLLTGLAILLLGNPGGPPQPRTPAPPAPNPPPPAS